MIFITCSPVQQGTNWSDATAVDFDKLVAISTDFTAWNRKRFISTNI
jgi:hypothetical protein